MIQLNCICDRCGMEKTTNYTDTVALALAYNLVVSGIRYYLCVECERGLLEYIANEDMGTQNA